MKKEITFFYLDEVEKWAIENIYHEAIKHGFKVKYSKNLKEKCEIGIYSQDKYVKTNSKLSIIMLHGMDQGRVNWPNHWSKEPWNKYDVGFLPGKSWSERWIDCSWDPFSQTKKGVYEVGWPKSDKIFKNEFYENIKNLKKKLNLKYKDTILYAPSFETDNKQIDICNKLKDLKVNLLVKHWLTSEDYNNNIDLKKNIDEANDYLNKNMSNGTILNSNLSIIDCLAMSDILITDESSVLYEAFLLDIPTISISDWMMRKNNSSRPRLIKPSKECYKIAEKSNLISVIKEIIHNQEKVSKEINQKKNYHYSNLGRSSKVIISILNEIILNDNYKNVHKLLPKYKKKNYVLYLRPLKNIILKLILPIVPMMVVKFFSKNDFLKSKFNRVRKF